MHSLLNIIGTLVHRSFCFISDHTDHNVMMVYKIQQLFTEYLKAEHPNIKNWSILAMVVLDNIKIKRICITCVDIRRNSGYKQSGISLLLLMVNLPVMV